MAGEPVADELPGRDDPYWLELTAETLDFLRDLRRAQRRRRIGRAAYVGYVITVICLLYVGPWVWYALSRPAGAGHPGGGGRLALAAVGCCALVLVGFARDGGWRGPAVLDLPTSTWLLPAPIERRALLLPRWRVSLLLSASAGVCAGAAIAVAARVTSGGHAAWLAAAGATTGLMAASLGTAAGGLAEARATGPSGSRMPSRSMPSRSMPSRSMPSRSMLPRSRMPSWLLPALCWLLPALLLALAAVPAGRGGRAWLGPVDAAALWSGPWGWLAQPLVAALPGTAPAGVQRLWPLGLALAVLTTALAVVRVERRIGGVPAAALRSRAESVALVGGALMMLQPRRARLTVLAAQGHAPSTRVRLPVPRRRGLLAPWRDATALLRAPSRLLWGLVWLGLALAVLALTATVELHQGSGSGSGALAAAGTATGGELRAALGRRLLLGLPGLVALYLAAAQLVEPARLDADDARRLRIRPVDAGRQALQHVTVPLVVLGGATLGVLAVAAAAGATAVVTAAGWTLLGLPGMLGAAMVSAYRGDAPLQLLVGPDTPLGGTGPVQLLLWYLRGPLVGIALLVPAILGLAIGAFTAEIAAVALLAWAVRRAGVLAVS